LVCPNFRIQTSKKKKFQTTPLFTRPNSKIRKNQRRMKSVGLKKKFTFDKSFYFISFLGLGSPLLEKERQFLFGIYFFHPMPFLARPIFFNFTPDLDYVF